MQKYQLGRSKLIEQENESSLVKSEFDRLDEEANIYKLVGNVLVK